MGHRPHALDRGPKGDSDHEAHHTCGGHPRQRCTRGRLAAGASFAAANPSGTGQPPQECGSSAAPNRPGHAELARGSAFNPEGVAGTHYAGEQPQNSHNPHSVSQYDVACFQVSQH
ncbi:hypothetical protein GCM10010193_37740 [Kitasatospora atroaurantiaca]